MKIHFALRVLALAAFPAVALPGVVFAQQLAVPTTIGQPTDKVYRQVAPDGEIIYSDKLIKGTKLDETIRPDPTTKGALWTGESGKPPVIPEQTETTPVNRVPTVPDMDRERTRNDAVNDVIKAEMLLEDAKKRRDSGVEPLPGERTGLVSGKSRLNEQYQARQQSLAADVAAAEAMLKKARAERNTMR